jgi:hypothetical protein
VKRSRTEQVVPCDDSIRRQALRRDFDTLGAVIDQLNERGGAFAHGDVVDRFDWYRVALVLEQDFVAGIVGVVGNHQKAMQLARVYIHLQRRATGEPRFIVAVTQHDEVWVRAGIEQHLPDGAIVVRDAKHFNQLDQAQEPARANRLAVDRQLRLVEIITGVLLSNGAYGLGLHFVTFLKGKPSVAKTWYCRNASNGCGRRQAGRLYHFHDSLNLF